MPNNIKLSGSVKNPTNIVRRSEIRRSSAVNACQLRSNRPNVSHHDYRIQRPLTVNYELSEDLRAKEIEFTERRYGGRIIANRAARIIQSTYREYQMRKYYQQLKIEKRISRKLDLPLVNYSSQTYKSPSTPNSPEMILEEIKLEDLKKQSSFEDLVLEQAYHDWNKEITEPSHSDKSLKLNESLSNMIDHQSAINNTDSGVDSVETSSISLTPSPTATGSFSILTSSPSGVLKKADSSLTAIEVHVSSNNEVLLSQPILSQSFKVNNTCIPSSHSIINLTDHHNKRFVVPVSKCCSGGNLTVCCDHLVNNSFHGLSSSSSSSPKYKLAAETARKCCIRQNASFPIYQCTINSNMFTTTTPIAGYLTNPRLIGCKFHKSSSCYCQTYTERRHKRLYRICLNIFNKNSLKGVSYLVRYKFLEPLPSVIAKFLLTRKGLSRFSIGEYLGQTKDELAMETLKCFVRIVDMRNKEIDVALRHLLSFFQLPGESQKIKRIMEEFQESYIEQNLNWNSIFKNPDTIMILSYAIIMLHTDMYNPNVRKHHKMTKDDFIRNLRKVDDGEDINPVTLNAIYDRIKAAEIKTFTDHTDQVRKIHQHFSGHLRPQNLIQPHRRLVCYCRLFEVIDCNKKDRPGAHQREVFLFNDMLVVTKSVQKRKKDGVMYQCRNVISLNKVEVYLFETNNYQNGIQLKNDDNVIVSFNTKTVTDRKRFVEDLLETISEVKEMDRIRIEEELLKQSCSAASPKLDSTTHDINYKVDNNNVMEQDLLRRKGSHSSDNSSEAPVHRHQRSSSNGGNFPTKGQMSSMSDLKSADKSSPDIGHSYVYNVQHRISGDSGLQEDFE